jgi:catechol 2,3-dioxygenase-like lactoylglutathione lyase family enzyme
MEIKGLHHNAYRCSDSEQTRRFYEDFLGLPLTNVLEIGETKTGRDTEALHSFYQLADGSFLAFFEVPGSAFEFKEQHDYDLHIALEVQHGELAPTLERARAAGIEVRGISDHAFIDSIYLRDPDGYVIELTAKRPDHDQFVRSASGKARGKLDAWQAAKRRRPAGEPAAPAARA